MRMKKNKGDGQCLKLRLIAWDECSRDEVTSAGHIVSTLLSRIYKNIHIITISSFNNNNNAIITYSVHRQD